MKNGPANLRGEEEAPGQPLPCVAGGVLVALWEGGKCQVFK